MTPVEGVKNLLEEDGANNSSLLLKKLVLCFHLGWFRFNGQAPDKSKILFDYLFDGKQLLIDFRLLDSESEFAFLQWLLTAHDDKAKKYISTHEVANRHLGSISELPLGYFGWLTNYLFYRESYLFWSLDEPHQLLNYQLSSIEIKQGEGGLLVKLNKTFIDNKDKNNSVTSSDASVNSKRLFLSNTLVHNLIFFDLKSFNYQEALSVAHPFALEIESDENHLNAMQEYRRINHLTSLVTMTALSWYRFFPARQSVSSIELEAKRPVNDYQLILEENGLIIYKSSKKILVLEKRPDIDTLVFCGGGAKIFAHLGAIKALEESSIRATRFSGSSGGAIIALFQYLGYGSENISLFFENFNQDKLIYYNIDRTGFSSVQALKAALDFMIIKKINQIIRKYALDENPEGVRFLANYVFNKGKIHFSSLYNIKKRFPDCGLGDELIVTATDLDENKTSYFSWFHMDTEISEAIATSGSFPWLFKPTIINGKTHSDGGILDNFPTEVFKDRRQTLLESNFGNCFNVLAFHFDNGCERPLLDGFSAYVYRENFLSNFVYGYITGVSDPVSGWERDRIKLIQYSNQTVIIPVGNVSATNFNLDSSARADLLTRGYEETRAYVDCRYAIIDGRAVNEEYLYSNFSSLKEFIYYCCHRHNQEWFLKIAKLAIAEGTLSEAEVSCLEGKYFRELPLLQEQKPSEIFATDEKEALTLIDKFSLFEAIYSVFYTMSERFIKDPKEIKFFKWARHSYSLTTPFLCIEELKKIKQETHVLFAIFLKLLIAYQEGETDKYYLQLKTLKAIISSTEVVDDPNLYANWQLSTQQIELLFATFIEGQERKIIELCLQFKQNGSTIEDAVGELNGSDDNKDKVDSSPSFNA